MEVAVVRYNAGNARSVLFALQRLGIEGVWTDDPERLRGADRVIFPGVGEASTAMRYLRERGLDKVICELKQPVLGICLGLQLLCEWSEEGDTECLGVFPHRARRFQHDEKIPHVGWNMVVLGSGERWWSVVPAEYMYFVHSYYVELGEGTRARTEYVHPFSSVVEWRNFLGVQFHPERSGAAGAQLLEGFLS